MAENEEADGFSREIAGKGKLDDEMLPNRGEPVPQEQEPQSERRDSQAAAEMQAGGGPWEDTEGEGLGMMRRTATGDTTDIQQASSTGETGGMGGSQTMDQQNQGATPMSSTERTIEALRMDEGQRAIQEENRGREMGREQASDIDVGRLRRRERT